MLQNTTSITALVAILLFLIKEIFELFKSRNKQKRELKSIYFLLQQEITKNIESLRNLEKFCKFIDENKDRDKTRLDILLANNNFYYCMATIGEKAQIQLPLLPYYTDQYNRYIHRLIELDSKHALEISENYTQICFHQEKQEKIIKLIEGKLQGFLYDSTVMMMVNFIPYSSLELIQQLNLLTKKISFSKTKQS